MSKNNQKQMNVSVIIPSYNGEGLLRRNLPYILAAKENKNNKISEIIVVDDGSPDNSVSLLRKNYPQVRTIKLKVHRGFSSAVNTGVRSSKGNLIALINNDVIPNDDFLVSVLPHFENEDVFAVSLHEKGYGWSKATFKDGYILIGPGSETNAVHSTFWVSGGSGVFRKSQFIKLGGLDEALLSPFMWEDLDLSYRASKRGLKLIWEPNAHVSHEHESTIKLFPPKYTSRIKERNQLLFIWKNLTSTNLFKKHLAGLFSRTLRHPGYLRIVLMALTRINIVIKHRRKEIKETKVSDEAILTRFK
jgi:GT2 family glycosyltransferase